MVVYGDGSANVTRGDRHEINLHARQNKAAFGMAITAASATALRDRCHKPV